MNFCDKNQKIVRCIKRTRKWVNVSVVAEWPVHLWVRRTADKNPHLLHQRLTQLFLFPLQRKARCQQMLVFFFKVAFKRGLTHQPQWRKSTSCLLLGTCPVLLNDQRINILIRLRAVVKGYHTQVTKKLILFGFAYKNTHTHTCVWVFSQLQVWGVEQQAAITHTDVFNAKLRNAAIPQPGFTACFTQDYLQIHSY